VPLTLVTGPANAEKAGVVLDAYEAVADRDPVLVVPTFADVGTYRRELADRGLVFGARVDRWSRLARLIADRAGVGGRVAGRLARERLAALVVARTELRVLGASAQTPGFVPAFLRLADELAGQRIDPGRWYAAVRAWASAEPLRADYAEELAALVSAWARALERAGRVDGARQTAQALDVLRTEPGRWGGTPVFLYGFDDLTALQRDAVETLAVHVGADVMVSLPYEPGRVAFAGRATTFAQLAQLGAEVIDLPARSEHYAAASRETLHHLERFLFEVDGPGGGPPARVRAGGAVRLLRGGGERAELELVGAHVAQLIADGTAPGEIAVVIRRPAERAALVERVFGDLGIPFALTRRVRVGHTALGRGLLALVRCALLDADADELLAYLRTPGLLKVPALADALEEQVRKAGLRTAKEARDRWEATRFPLDAIDRVARAAADGPGALCERLAAEAASLFANPFRGRAALLDEAESVDAQVAAELRRALGELAGLAGEDGGGGLVPGPADLVRLLDGLEILVGRREGPGAVTVADPKDIRARRVRALFCCGLQEGAFPATARPEPFLGDAERRAINAASGLRLALHEDPLRAERHLFYAAVSRPTELLALSWHAADEDGAPQVRSPFVDDVLDLLEPDVRVEDRPLGAAGFADLPALAAPTARERARAQAADAAPAPAPVIAPLGDRAVLEGLAARETWSASALEAWLSCPVKWFVERFLRPEELAPDPEPMIRGQLAHKVLEEALQRLTAGGEPRPLRPADLPEVRRLAHEAIERCVAEYRLSASRERALAALRRLEADVLRYLDWAASTDSDHAPAAFEVTFGTRDSATPAVDLGGGLRLSGRIDRVDLDPGGSAIVYDYKGKTATAQAAWARDGRLQLALYMLALPEVLDGVRTVDGGLYQPLGAEKPQPRGLLRADVDRELDTVKTDRVDDDRFDEVLDDARRRAVATVAAIRSGRLVPAPGTCHWKGGGCSYPSICRCEQA
jgi:ATP-dependent helicase/DNAse subunit B